jgi:hypothetical protein
MDIINSDKIKLINLYKNQILNLKNLIKIQINNKINIQLYEEKINTINKLILNIQYSIINRS